MYPGYPPPPWTAAYLPSDFPCFFSRMCWDRQSLARVETVQSSTEAITGGPMLLDINYISLLSCTTSCRAMVTAHYSHLGSESWQCHRKILQIWRNRASPPSAIVTPAMSVTNARSVAWQKAARAAAVSRLARRVSTAPKFPSVDPGSEEQRHHHNPTLRSMSSQRRRLKASQISSV